VPARLTDQSPQPILQHILSQVRERNASTQVEWREQIALSLAESAAIPYGRSLSPEEMKDLVSRLLRLPSYLRTPDGKTVLTRLSDDEINQRF
jgi:DNA mismatch repair protein MutL